MAEATGDQQMAPAGSPEFHGDLLETVLSHVPLVDLVSASYVSKSWCDAVSSSLRHHNQPRPWLVLHTQTTHCPYVTRTHAYDPRSNLWIKVSRPSDEHISAIKSSHNNFVYMLSPLRFSFSFDLLNFNWYHVDPPLVWRSDPIVARVGKFVVIAGGGCDFEDDPLAVEIYDLNTNAWCTSDSMPGCLREVAASTWLSIAVTSEKLIVTDKESGVTHWFDPETKSWYGPFNLGTGRSVSSYNIGCIHNSLILVGLCKIQNVERVKVWRLGEDFECDEIGEMPLDYVEKLKSESFDNFSINVRVGGNTMYVYNTAWDVEEVVAGDLFDDGGCRWWSVKNVAARDGVITKRLIYTCSEVGIDELQQVMMAENRRFEVIH